MKDAKDEGPDLRRMSAGELLYYVTPKTKLRNCGNCGQETVNYYNCSYCIKHKLSNDVEAGIFEETEYHG